MMRVSYHSSNLSLIALEAMRLLVQMLNRMFVKLFKKPKKFLIYTLLIKLDLVLFLNIKIDK